MKQKRLTDHFEPATPLSKTNTSSIGRPVFIGPLFDEDLGDVKNNPLWPILVETTRRNPLYPGLASYLQAHILPERPDISPRELAGRLSISIGEALVLLDEAHSKTT
ncbi:MAG: hypothetical protein K9W43_09725 [Candidatus Thorarchaeota archaeon]|nr:hypothetical protein [Candidatus Thorarchaeota archaeon]